jgi:hypothetical protein
MTTKVSMKCLQTNGNGGADHAGSTCFEMIRCQQTRNVDSPKKALEWMSRAIYIFICGTYIYRERERDTYTSIYIYNYNDFN